MGPITPTNGPISKIQLGGCVVDSLEKVKHIAKTKYIETVCLLYWVCLKLKIFRVVGVSVFVNRHSHEH